MYEDVYGKLVNECISNIDQNLNSDVVDRTNNFHDDLGFDELDMVELMFLIHEVFNVDIIDLDRIMVFETLETIDQVVKLIEQKLDEQ